MNAKFRQQWLGAMLPGPERNYRYSASSVTISPWCTPTKIKGQQAGVLAAERTKARAFRQCVFRQRRQPP
ncbi:hypothetical protein LFZ31_27545, partial [Salmonella enterica subsp. enterica serovar Newport str. S09097]